MDSPKLARSSSQSDIYRQRGESVVDENVPQRPYNNNSAELCALQTQIDAHKHSSRPLRSPRGLHSIIASSHESENTMKMLMKALDEANRTIQEQATLITHQQNEITSLKQLLRKHSLTESVESTSSPIVTSESCSRRRANFQRALQIEKTCLQWQSPDTNSPQVSISQVDAGIDTPLCDTPTPDDTASLPAVLEFATSPTSAPPPRLVTRLRMDPTQRRRKAAAKKLAGLANKIATMSSEEEESSSDRYINTEVTPTATPTISPDNISTTPATFQFHWKKLQKECLFIAHDNPKLGQSVNGVLNGMKICVESKGTLNNVEYSYFIMGRVIYCGAVENVETSEGHDFSRGSQCLVVTDLLGYRIDLKTVPKRLVGDIMEIDVSGGAAGPFNREFFRPCITSRVDVILDPIHSQSWYPYWESMGHRKMAPQFRSTGIGYLRLGDDMGRFGTSFMSYDGFVTFLDEGKSLLSSANLAEQLSASTKSIISGGSTRVHWEEIAYLLMSMRDKAGSEVKWNERLEKLQTLLSYLTQNAFNWEAQHVGEVSAIIEDHLRTCKNPHVLRIALQIVAELGIRVMKLAMAAGNMWKSLLTQAVHLLRHSNKLVSDAAMTSLVFLQDTSAGLSIVSSIIDDVMLGPTQRANAKGSTCSNTQKVLKWLSGLADFEFIAVLSRPPSNKRLQRSNSETSIDSTASARVKPWCILSRLISVLSHRVELVREAACQCAATLLALDIATFSSCRASDGTSYNFPLSAEALFDALSSQSRPLLEEIGMAVSPKMQSKVCDLIIKYLRKYKNGVCHSKHSELNSGSRPSTVTNSSSKATTAQNMIAHKKVDDTDALAGAWMEAKMCLRLVPSTTTDFTWKSFAEVGEWL